jgi:hypothetical protein
MQKFSDSLSRFGAETPRRFFVENGAWLLPD